MAERHRGGQEAVFRDVRIRRCALAGIEHVEIAHAEVAAERVQAAQVEIDQPRIFVNAVVLVLRIVAVGQAAVREMVVTLRVDRPVPGGLLQQHDLAVCVKDRGKGAGARDAGVVVHAAPGRDRGVDIAVRGAETELLLNNRRKAFAELDGAGGLGRVAALPRVLQLILARA